MSWPRSHGQTRIQGRFGGGMQGQKSPGLPSGAGAHWTSQGRGARASGRLAVMLGWIWSSDDPRPGSVSPHTTVPEPACWDVTKHGLSPTTPAMGQGKAGCGLSRQAGSPSLPECWGCVPRWEQGVHPRDGVGKEKVKPGVGHPGSRRRRLWRKKGLEHLVLRTRCVCGGCFLVRWWR